jgi:tetratricopeptide (TPR) repeat protein
MLAYSRGDYDQAVSELGVVLAEDPGYIDARLALGMAFCRKGDYASAIAEGHKAERLRPDDQLVHTNLSVFYMKAGDKSAAEHHALRSRVAGWKNNLDRPSATGGQELGLGMAAAKPKNVKLPGRLPDMPWKKSAS